MNASYQVVPEKVIGFTAVDKRWEVASLPSNNFGQFMQDYHILEIAVLDVIGNELTFYPYKHAAELLHFTGSLQQWFDTKAGIAIPTLKPGHPTLEFSSSHFQPLTISSEVTIGLAPHNTHPSQDFAIDDARDIVLQVSDDKIQRYNSNLLYCVDGIWVRDLAESYGIRLMGGGDIVRHGSGGNVSALVLNDIGDVTTYDINKDVVFKVDTDQSYYTSLTIKTPVSITGKTVGLVFAGKLFWIDAERYFSDTSVGITFTNEDILAHIMDTADRFDWDVLGLGDFSSPTHVSRIRSDTVMEILFDHISTFLVIIDNDYVERAYQPIATRGAVGRWHVNDKNGTLVLGHIVNQLGNLVDYWPRWDKGVWTFYTKAYDFKRYLLNYSKWHKQTIINDAIAIHEQPYVAPMLTMCNLKARKK